MPTAKVTKNVSAAIGGGNVLCSTLISIKTKAWLYSFHTAINGLSYFYTQSRQYREESRALAGLPFVISFAGIDYLCLYMTITDKVFPHTFTLFFFAA